MASRLPRPQLVVNLKAYPQTLGRRAVALARASVRLEEAAGVIVAVCPQGVDLRACAATGARVYAQHFDRILKPEATGWQSLDALVDAGCQGTLINHSEHRIGRGDLDWYADQAHRAGLATILCTRDSNESRSYARSHPDVVAIEPPELIGGDISVTSADPGVVRRSVAAVRASAPGTPVLCGAGVKNATDVARALELGAHGILVASGVTKAPSPAAAMKALARGFGMRG